MRETWVGILSLRSSWLPGCGLHAISESLFPFTPQKNDPAGQLPGRLFPASLCFTPNPPASRSQLKADAAQSRVSVCWEGRWPRGESCWLPGLWPPLSQLCQHSAQVGVAGPCSFLGGELLEPPSITLLLQLWDEIIKCRLVIAQENEAPVKLGLRCSR